MHLHKSRMHYDTVTRQGGVRLLQWGPSLLATVISLLSVWSTAFRNQAQEIHTQTSKVWARSPNPLDPACKGKSKPGSEKSHGIWQNPINSFTKSPLCMPCHKATRKLPQQPRYGKQCLLFWGEKLSWLSLGIGRAKNSSNAPCEQWTELIPEVQGFPKVICQYRSPRSIFHQIDGLAFSWKHTLTHTSDSHSQHQA